MRLTLSLLFVALWATPASAQFHTYSSWAQLDQRARGHYIAGVWDTYVAMSQVLGDGLDVEARRFHSCLLQQGLTDTQLSDNIRAFAAARPDLQTYFLSTTMLVYLRAFCGPVTN